MIKSEVPMYLLKVRVRRGDWSKDEEQYVYPSVYNAKEVDRMGMHGVQLALRAVTSSGAINRGGGEEYMIIAMPEVEALKYANDPDMMIINSIEADKLMAQWAQDNGVPDEIVRDDRRLLAIDVKIKAGQPLSIEDEQALDKDSPIKGINKSVRPIKDLIDVKEDTLQELPQKLKEIQKV